MSNLEPIIIVGPSMSGVVFEEIVRKALARENAGEPRVTDYVTPIEYVYDGTVIPEHKVFPTDSQKGN